MHAPSLFIFFVCSCLMHSFNSEFDGKKYSEQLQVSPTTISDKACPSNFLFMAVTCIFTCMCVCVFICICWYTNIQKVFGHL